MSCGVPRVCVGTAARIWFRYSSPWAISPSLSTLPGMTALMVMPNRAYSSAALRMKPSCPALLAP
jgi:hypothetical protein